MNTNPISMVGVDSGGINESLLAIGITKSSQSGVIVKDITSALLGITRRVLKANGITKLSQVEHSEHHVMKAVCSAVINGSMDNLSHQLDKLESVATEATIEFSLRKPSKSAASLEEIFLAEDYPFYEQYI